MHLTNTYKHAHAHTHIHTPTHTYTTYIHTYTQALYITAVQYRLQSSPIFIVLCTWTFVFGASMGTTATYGIGSVYQTKFQNAVSPFTFM